MDEVTVRLAYKEDIRGMYAIEKSSFATPWSIDAFAENFFNNCSIYVLAEYEGRIIGFGGMQVILDEAHVMNVAVHGSKRRLGAATKMMELMFITAEKRGAKEMFLEVRSSNEPAKALYEKLGFKKLGVRKKYYSDNGEDAVIMKKKL